MATPKKLPSPSVTLIKTEPGTSKNPSLRLPSFKNPRDMMLGGRGPGQEARSAPSRKVYVPNVNVQRKKHEAEQPGNKPERGAGRGRERGRGGTGRGRGDRLNNKAYIQTATGLFADGITPLEGRYKRGSGGGGGGGGGGSGGISLKKHSLIKTEGKLLDRNVNEERLSALLQDDFIDDPESMANSDNQPTQLPLLKIKSDRVLKKEHPLKVKLEESETNGEAKGEELHIASTLPVFEHQEIFTMSQLINSTRENLVLLKLPTSMPQFEGGDEIARPSTSKTQADEPAEDNSTTATPEQRELPEGRVGKLQLLKSGRVRLIIGDQVLYTQLGLHTQLKQDLIYVDVDASTPGGNMINLGPINARIVSTLSVNPTQA